MLRAMSAKILDGKALSAAVRNQVRERIAKAGRPARLDAVLVGNDSAAELYAQNQARTCGEVGIEYRLHRLPEGSGFEEVAGRVLLLNEDESVRAIMVHLPLPTGVDVERVQSLIAPDKDVEGVNPANIGNVVYGRRSLVPCTARAVVELVEASGVTLRGAHCVVVGASNIVGKPVAVLLMRAEATVTSGNKFTPDMAAIARTADVLVVAAGVQHLVKADWIKPGAVVIDVGIHRKLDASGVTTTSGDVDFEAVRQVAGFITPVPGGVGPMTVAMLLRNVADACLR
ncbi:MAG: bifunctional methylenetetrahydrofolate dehydrogenase/methenyltetrahydrofolate cyclohydrolase FolD [Planctomycetota bacterium]|jgi:methylenetetrahydrofolate dehydrogenase (NADP+)/methenyltetrahydrofolate cyclohydrolase